jgi:hypothetical protein
MIPMNPFGILNKLGAAGGAIRSAGLKALGSDIAWNAGRYLASNAGRTVAGAGLGALYGAWRGDDYSASRIAGYGLMGAGLGRYGGAFMRAGMTRGMGIRGSAEIAAGIARADGKAAMRFIGTAAVASNRGYRKIRGLFR